ncbi:PGF-CTERM sorting domain-containing protein [Halobacteriales archaeon SW_8_68_21]|nr:MAG: PGF-CTERM sorting domain-containing protein [Halobacteriales archaeon SW_8_68_21]
MTNDNNTRKKANAVFFAAVMVVSMVAAGFAAAPAAAAVTGISGTSADDVPVGNSAATQDVVFEVSIEENDTDVPVEVDLSAAADAGVEPSIDSVSTDGSDVNVTTGSLSGGVHTFEVSDATEGDGAHTTNVTVTYSHDTSSLENGDSTSGNAVSFDITADNNTGTNGSVAFDLTETTVSPSYAPDQDLYFSGQEFTVSGLQANSDYQIREVTSTNDDGNVTNTDPFEQFSSNGTGEYVIDTGGFETGSYILRGPGIEDEDATEFEVTVQSLTTDFADDTVDNDGDTTVDLEVDSDRGTYTIEVTSDDFAYDDEDLEQIFDESFETNVNEGDEVFELVDVTDDDYATNFSGVDAGNYSFDFDVTDTDAADTGSVTVNDVGDGELNIDPSSITDQQGDVVPITVSASEAATSGELVIGNEEDVGYQANVTITDFGDDDEVTVYFNTYAAGNATEFGAGNVVYLDEDDLDEDANIDFTENNETDIDNQLDTGDYELAVSTQSDNPSDTLNSPDNVGTLFVEERSTGEDVNTWTVSDTVAGDIVDADDSVEALNERVGENLTQSDSIANGDQVVHQIEASGLTGILEATGADGDTSQFTQALNDSDSEGISLRLRETRASAGPNEDLRMVNVSSTSGVNVVVDDEADVLYVIVDTDTISFEEEGDIESGEEVELDARLRIEDERLLNFNRVEQSNDDVDEVSDIHESATGTYDIAEPTASFEQDPYNVSNAEGQVVTGSSNLAVENEVTLRVRSSGDTRPAFSKSDTVDVAADGSFETELDFSEQAVGDEYTITARNNLFENPEVDGTVVESVDEGGNATFEVSGLEPAEATATAGDSVTVSATIENTGDSEVTQTVALTLDGDDLDTTEVTLAGGNSTTVEFTADTSGLEAGDYTHGVATDDDEATGTLTIEAAGGDDGGDDSAGDDSSGDDSSGDDSSGDDSAGDDSSGDDSTDDGTPGFGALVALVALIAAALLATRRND